MRLRMKPQQNAPSSRTPRITQSSTRCGTIGRCGTIFQLLRSPRRTGSTPWSKFTPLDTSRISGGMSSCLHVLCDVHANVFKICDRQRSLGYCGSAPELVRVPNKCVWTSGIYISYLCLCTRFVRHLFQYFRLPSIHKHIHFPCSELCWPGPLLPRVVHTAMRRTQHRSFSGVYFSCYALKPIVSAQALVLWNCFVVYVCMHNREDYRFCPWV